MKVTQLSVFLENKPGTLSRPVNLLARAGLNILALSLADTQQFGILRLIVQDWSAAKELLEKNIVNLEYMYGFTQRQAGRGLLLFRFEDPDRAIQVLQKHGINPVHSVELFRAKGKMARKAAAAT